VSSPNPKRSKLQKESNDEDGVNHGGDGLKQGGVVSSYLAKINMETAAFQNSSRNGKKGGKGKVTERKKYMNTEIGTAGALNFCIISPNKKAIVWWMRWKGKTDGARTRPVEYSYQAQQKIKAQ
jgi:hypothetical protein